MKHLIPKRWMASRRFYSSQNAKLELMQWRAHIRGGSSQTTGSQRAAIYEGG